MSKNRVINIITILYITTYTKIIFSLPFSPFPRKLKAMQFCNIFLAKTSHQRGENGRDVISSLVGLRLAPHEITARHK